MHHIKRRPPAVPGSIPAVLRMFESEVRFYREIAPVVGVRVPACYEAEETADGTLLVLEDLSAWRPGVEPAAGAAALRSLHDRWAGRAPEQWPWLRPTGAAVDLVARLYDETWPRVAARGDLSPSVRALGERLVGQVEVVEGQLAGAGELTLAHGDASGQNLRTGPDGEIAFLDWEDVSAAPGAVDLAWFLVSTVEPERWDEALEAYGPCPGLVDAMPSTAVQGFLSLADWPEGLRESAAWNARLEAAAAVLV